MYTPTFSVTILDTNIREYTFDNVPGPKELARETALARFQQENPDTGIGKILICPTRLVALATDMFHGDGEAAQQWLKSPAHAFKGETPLEHAQTEYGTREVENLIGRIRHGIPS